MPLDHLGNWRRAIEWPNYTQHQTLVYIVFLLDDANDTIEEFNVN